MNIFFKTILVLTFSTQLLFAQDAKQLAYDKAMEAIELMDNGKYQESIALFEECKKMDPENINYPYEIGLAHVYNKDYKSAIKVLKKLVNHKNINDQVYQLLGNAYSISGNSKKAIKTYSEGLSKFPEAGNLYLETGNIYAYQEDYDQAIYNFEKAVEVDPMYPSSYYRLAELFLNSDYKLPGLIYGEIFMNLERTTDRTTNMSELLYKSYVNSIDFKQDEISLDFCSDVITMEASTFLEEEFKLPFCLIYSKSFAFATLEFSEINLSTLSKIRSNFLELHMKEHSEDYPNYLFEYQNKMKELGHYNAYNHYLFQVPNQDEFDTWASENHLEFQEFVNWYIDKENEMQITKENRFIRE